MHCTKCGNQLGKGDQFCAACGERVSASSDERGASSSKNPDEHRSGIKKSKGWPWPIWVVLAVLLAGLIVVVASQSPSASTVPESSTGTDVNERLELARSIARDTVRIANVAQLMTAVELYHEDHFVYPTEFSERTLGKYIEKFPTDPLTGQPYLYVYGPGDKPTTYDILTELEQRATALDKDADLSWKLPDGTVVNGASEACTSAPMDCLYDMGYGGN